MMDHSRSSQLSLVRYFEGLIDSTKKKKFTIPGMLKMLDDVIDNAVNDEVLDMAQDVKHKLECIRDSK